MSDVPIDFITPHARANLAEFARGAADGTAPRRRTDGPSPAAVLLPPFVTGAACRGVYRGQAAESA